MKVEEFDLVRLKRPLPALGLPEGARGTALIIYRKPELAFEVEFLDSEGESLGVVTLSPEDVEKVED
jgi:hypothetical protein